MAEKVDQMDPDEKIVEIAIERLRVFENHPFRVEMDSQMKDLQDSIKKYGIITPVIELNTFRVIDSMQFSVFNYIIV